MMVMRRIVLGIFFASLLSTCLMGDLFDPAIENPSFENPDVAGWGFDAESWFSRNGYVFTVDAEGDAGGQYPAAPDGGQVVAIKGDTRIWQQIGSWDYSQDYVISFWIAAQWYAHDPGLYYNDIDVEIWGGGDPAQAANGKTPEDIGAIKLSSVHFGSESDDSGEYVAPILNTGYDRLLQSGDPIWLSFYNPNTSGNVDLQKLIDDVSISRPSMPHSSSPADGEPAAATDAVLTWSDPTDIPVSTYNIWFGTEPNVIDNPKTMGLTEASYSPGMLSEYETYYWKVEAVADSNTVSGLDWTFTVAPPAPTISVQPLSQTIDAGTTLELSVAAQEGDSVDSYQWFKDDEAIANAVESVLTIDDFQQDDEGMYHCELTNAGGATSSQKALVLTKRLFAHWKFENNLLNEVDNALYEGVSVNPTYDPNNGIDGVAFNLGHGTSDDIITISNSDIDPLMNFHKNGFTVCAWIKAISQSGYHCIMARSEHQVNGWSLWDLDNNMMGHLPPLDDIGTGARVGGDNKWHHVAMCYDKELASCHLYVDGRTVAYRSVAASPKSSTAPMVIGDHSVLTLPLVGNTLIDDVRLYTYPLDSIDIGMLYADYSGETFCYENPAADLSGPDGGPDCQVDLYDLTEMASQWLLCNIIPSCN